ncbi:hypothetical protein [Deinococcus maricopensis]|uniref:hypothetical protein n=1 Tax=Deinococcus maricopensis TaxID=309887 RepID=UPI0002F0A214
MTTSPRETLSTTTAPDATFLNRELSWLAFNERVLAEARDLRNPPLERLKYCAICGSNLDEFFMVRVAGIHRQIAANVSARGLDGLQPPESLALVRTRVRVMLREIERTTRKTLAELRRAGVRLVRMGDLGRRACDQVRAHYEAQIQPVLTPLVVDPSHPFPYLSNLSLNLAVLLAGGMKGRSSRG